MIKPTLRGLLAAALFALPLTTPAAAPAEVLPLADAVAALPAGVESRDGYTRAAFRHWVDADRDSCSTAGADKSSAQVTALIGHL
ncbi:hypothetical protein ABZ590_25130 [Streptomyces hirsutus]|uniref:hypothetical protein n=1 Tax=Streptomyces hirsutus TaxID=35620 RepID=UPI0033E7A624